MNAIKNQFDAVYCINLQRRSDRWERFAAQIPTDWPFRQIERFEAVDGRQCPSPTWWRQGGGAWGCYRSHLALIEQALNRGLDSILLLEDDALFGDDFSSRAREFIEALPDDWGMLYFGGQHLFAKRHPPERVNDYVFRPYNVNRTHAFALRGATLRKVYRHLCTQDWKHGHHIDHHLGRFHQRREDPIYCPKEWLVGQSDGRSNISGRVAPQRFWADSKTIADADPEKQPFVAVLGLHSSGSSCLAGVLYHLGLHLGNTLTGYYGNDPQANNCGFEAVGLMQICEAALPVPSTSLRVRENKLQHRLGRWINEKRREAAMRKTIAAGKYPQLCAFGPQLQKICGENLRVIVSDRRFEESVISLTRRLTTVPPEDVLAHQQFLCSRKQELLANLPHDSVLIVPYDALISDTEGQVERLAAFLGVSPTPVQREAIRTWVDKDKRHVTV